MVTAELYILYGFLAFIGLLQVTIVVVLVRQSFSAGRLESLIPQVEKIDNEINNLREQVAEVRGILFGLNSRIDLLMRHHHNEAGQVVIVPTEEVAAD